MQNIVAEPSLGAAYAAPAPACYPETRIGAFDFYVATCTEPLGHGSADGQRACGDSWRGVTEDLFLFSQEDPMGQAAGQASLFGYARSSPSQAIDPAGLLTVHVWTPHDDGWGHASITLENGTHISWWPSAHGREGSYYPEQPYLYSASPNKYQSFYRDVELEGNRLPDFSIKIDGLDEDAIEKWWDTFRKANRWKTLSQNCSTVAATALRKGGARFPPQLVWTPEDVLRLTASIRRQAEIASPPTARQGLTIPPALNRTFQ